MSDTVERPTPLLIAVAVSSLEALALVGVAAWVVVDGISAGGSRLGRGLLIAAFALAGAAVLALGAWGLHRLSQSARTPVLVVQLLAVPSGYSMAFQAHRPALGGPVLIGALLVIYCLFAPPVREIFDRQPRS